MSSSSTIFKPLLLCAALLYCLNSSAQQNSQALFRNPERPVEARVLDLLKQLTLEEKISLLGYRSPAIARLDLPAYNWWNEALHGVGRAGRATVFPQAIGMAATFNESLVFESATAISTEARAKHQLAVQQNRHLQYMGLSFWSPNINIFRDPRWGRGQETYGEDPFLTATMGVAFVKGMQGNDPQHLKTSACAKHFAVHSGPESSRHHFNALVDEKDLRETYLYAFKKLVDAGVESVMCAYNRVNDQPCCTGNILLRKILREEWQFKGHVVTDCWALKDIWAEHKVLPNSVEVTAAAIKAGVNLDCSNMLQDDVQKALEQQLLTTAELDSALAVLLRTAIKLGLYDAPASPNPYSTYGADSIANTYHTQLAREMARQSMVLLKNDKNLLPLNKNRYGSYMVIGPNAASLDALLGNYNGIPDKAVNFVEGITAALDPGTRIEYNQGCNDTDTLHLGGVWAASNAEITIAVIGLTSLYEGEEGDAFLSAGGGDKLSLSLPASHIALIKALRKRLTQPIVAVVTGGSALDLSSIEPYVDAIIYAWYPGAQGGAALADLLFGESSPAGRLPVTFYRSTADLPDYDDYSMQQRSYRYFDGEVQYPFGYGLSYTTFTQDWAEKPPATLTAKDSISFSLKLKNTGPMDGDEVVQVYLQYPAAERMPVKELKAFQRVPLSKGKETTVRFKIPVEELKKWDLSTHQWKLYPGVYQVSIGKNARDIVLSTAITINN